MAPRSQLASRRRNLGFSQETLAHRIEVSPRTVSMWETGSSAPSARHRRPLADALELTLGELEWLLEANGSAVPLNGHAVAPWLGHYASLEQGASELWTFEPMVVPALLQTEHYAAAVESAYHRPVTGEEVARRVEVRIARQNVLHRQGDPLELRCVIDEAVLHHLIGSPDIMDEQLDHLMTMAGAPNVHLRVANFDASPYGTAFGPFQLLTSPGSTTPYIACTESLTGMSYADSQSVVEGYSQLFEHLFTVALGAEESRDLIKQKRSN